jgi:DNA-binding response OmpR family regulator
MQKVLIVEDEPNVRRLYEMELRREGFDVECVASGEQCLACLDQTDPDLVVLDVMMPGMDGIDTLQQLRTRKRSLRVVLNTACSACTHNYLTWAADECLIKSSDTTELIETVKRLV